MRAYYINLDSQTERRDSIESSFRTCQIPGWTLTRFPAIGKDEVLRRGVCGRTSDGEKGCFLSHRALLEQTLADEEPILVLEDDAVFSPATFPLIDRFLAEPGVGEWDIAYTDVIIPRIETMADFVRLRREITDRQQVVMLDVTQFSFAGSTAYVVNGRSKRKLYDILASCDCIDSPYDLFVRLQIYHKVLHGHVFFPFITAVGDCSASSQIQRDEVQLTELIWSTFRRMIWLDRSIGSERQTLEAIGAHIEPEDCSAFGVLFSAMISSKYKGK